MIAIIVASVWMLGIVVAGALYGFVFPGVKFKSKPHEMLHIAITWPLFMTFILGVWIGIWIRRWMNRR